MGVTWEDLAEGTNAEPREFGPLTRTDFVRYHDEEYAKGAGFPTVFSVGMLQAGILATYATDWLGAGDVRRFGVQFREQVWPGDTLTCTGEVTKRYEDGGERLVDLELLCNRQTGGTAIKGWATFVAP
jgi:acyl dehydratase